MHTRTSDCSWRFRHVCAAGGLELHAGTAAPERRSTSARSSELPAVTRSRSRSATSSSRSAAARATRGVQADPALAVKISTTGQGQRRAASSSRVSPTRQVACAPPKLTDQVTALSTPEASRRCCRSTSGWRPARSAVKSSSDGRPRRGRGPRRDPADADRRRERPAGQRVPQHAAGRAHAAAGGRAGAGEQRSSTRCRRASRRSRCCRSTSRRTAATVTSTAPASPRSHRDGRRRGRPGRRPGVEIAVAEATASRRRRQTDGDGRRGVRRT